MTKENEANEEKVEKAEGETTKEEATEEETTKETYEELKARAEAVEAKVKALSEEAKSERLIADQRQRLAKAEAKLASLEGEQSQTKESKEDLAVRDLITLTKADISEDSDEARILERYRKGGLIQSYAEGLEHPGVKAEFAALKEKQTAEAVVDESDADGYLKTKAEIVANYKTRGEVPKDPKLREAIVEDNLKKMGL